MDESTWEHGRVHFGTWTRPLGNMDESTWEHRRVHFGTSGKLRDTHFHTSILITNTIRELTPILHRRNN